jgi:hypothetical protein
MKKIKFLVEGTGFNLLLSARILMLLTVMLRVWWSPLEDGKPWGSGIVVGALPGDSEFSTGVLVLADKGLDKGNFVAVKNSWITKKRWVEVEAGK